MDRTLKVYSKTDHLFAEFIFSYEHRQQATVRYTEYRRLYNDDEEDENKSVFPLHEMDSPLDFIQFDSIERIKAYDIETVKKLMGHYMKDPAGSYKYTYDLTPVLLRYVAENHLGSIGIINVVFSFIENTKEVKFLSATNPRFDMEISSDSLETNISCILRIPVYTDKDVRELSSYDLKKLPPWY